MKTKILKVDPQNPDPLVISEAAKVLWQRKLVVFPTETVYGVGAHAFDPKAVSRIFKVKQRPTNKPLAVCISELKQLNLVAKEISQLAKALIESFLPGPITLILSKNDSMPSIVTAGGQTVGVRYPDNKITLALIKQAGFPIATTSANLSGNPSPITAQQALLDLEGRVDLVLDGGPTLSGVESTVLDLTVSPPMIRRQGTILPEELNRVFKKLGYKLKVNVASKRRAIL